MAFCIRLVLETVMWVFFRVKQAAPQITETFEPSRIKLFLDVTPKKDSPEHENGDNTMQAIKASDKVAIKSGDKAKVAIKASDI